MLSIIFASILLFLNLRYIVIIIRSFNSMKERYQKNEMRNMNNKYKKKIKRILQKNRTEMSVKINSSKAAGSESGKYQPSDGVDDDEDEELPEWKDLNNKDKLKLFNTWSLV
jgi:hypothetical protein